MAWENDSEAPATVARSRGAADPSERIDNVNAIQIVTLALVGLTVVMSGLAVWFAVLSARYRRQTEESLRETERILAESVATLGLPTPRRHDGH